jgi:hypothetical protein
LSKDLLCPFTLTPKLYFCASTKSRYYAAVALGIWCANWETGAAALNKRGHFTILSSKERTSEAVPELPRYDISWIAGCY